jgi:hypothetical protein
VKGEQQMGVELVNRSFVRELFNVPERRAKTPMTLEQHKTAYQELVTTLPRDGSMRTIAEYMAGDEQYLLPHYIQSERDLRRLGLHRVEEAIDDLTKEERSLLFTSSHNRRCDKKRMRPNSTHVSVIRGNSRRMQNG